MIWAGIPSQDGTKIALLRFLNSPCRPQRVRQQALPSDREINYWWVSSHRGQHLCPHLVLDASLAQFSPLVLLASVYTRNIRLLQEQGGIGKGGLGWGVNVLLMGYMPVDYLILLSNY